MLFNCRPFSGTSLYAQTVIADGAAGYWRLGESSGTVATDSSGNAYHMTYSGSPTLGQPSLLVGDANKSVLWSGANKAERDPVNFDSRLYIENNFSAEAWVIVDATCPATFIVGSLQTLGWGIEVQGTTNRVSLDYNGGVALSVIYPTLTDGLPHHIVGTYSINGAGPGNDLTLYIDGAAQGTSLNRNTSASGTLTIGSIPSLPGGFIGRIDEVAFYDSVLSAAQVLDHYNKGIT